MCGLAGIAGLEDEATARKSLQAMVGRLRHRGPDDRGEFFAPGNQIALGHTRLSILDLSPAGHQPMHSADGRFVIVFNGEIYNFRRLREELESEGVRFRSHSDTEVILAMYARHRERCLKRFDGMFSLAIWDTVDKSLFLARDPLGIKPLYVWQHGSRIAFSSEIRSVLAADFGPRELDLNAAFDYFRLGSVPEPQTLVQGVSMVPAGNWMSWKSGVLSEPKCFWKIQFASTIHDLETACRLTRPALEESVGRHFVSDVPVGVFLSGGLDSTAILALARSSGHTNLQTFCISFDDQKFNEGHLAQRTAAHFGTRHTDWRMSAAEGQQLASKYLDAMDQPSSDGFNTYCVSKLAAECGIKVVLSGLGGDELFAGYPSFTKIPRLLKLKQRLSRFGLAAPLRQLISRCSQQPKWLRLAEFLQSEGSVCDAWLAMRGFFTSAESQRLVGRLAGNSTWKAAAPRSICLAAATQMSSEWSVKDQISWLELMGYMRNQLLRDSDVMSMAWGLELRVPFADRRLLDSVSVIDGDVRLAQGKQLLMKAVPEIPKWILNEPKRGFRFPFEDWVNHRWGDWFQQIDQTSPVRCQTWYRKWSLMVLQQFLDVNQINLPGAGLDQLTA